MRSLGRAAGVLALWLLASAHVGSPDAWYEGAAGPYHIVAMVQMPTVIPGIAIVRVTANDPSITRVTALVTRFDASAALPPPDDAAPVAGQPGVYQTPLWVMAGGSNAVTVAVHGSRGDGSAIVPVVAVASSRIPLSPWLGALLATVGLVLFAGAVTLVGSAVRESVVPPGEAPDGPRRRLARIAMGATTIVLALALLGGRAWWNATDAEERRQQYRPMAAEAAVTADAATRAVSFTITDSAWRHRNDSLWIRRHHSSSWSVLVPDHGKLMHLFLVKGDGSAFAHLHPTTDDSVRFTSELPPLPAGEYRAFADLVHESGFNETLVADVSVPASTRSDWAPTDGDDAIFVGAPTASDRVSLDSVLAMRFEGAASPRAREPLSLKFEVVTRDGQPAALEPYMGMAAHAVIARSDDSVFIHLHPSGTISMASQASFALRAQGDTAPGAVARALTTGASAHAMPSASAPGTVSFPYAFPKPGHYDVWVQVRTATGIRTGAFTVDVRP